MSKMKKVQQKSPSVKISYPMLYIQAILTILMIVLGIATFFSSKILPFFELSLGITLLDIAINNALFYKRNGGTFFYTLIGILLVFMAIIALVGDVF